MSPRSGQVRDNPNVIMYLMGAIHVGHQPDDSWVHILVYLLAVFGSALLWCTWGWVFAGGMKKEKVGGFFQATLLPVVQAVVA
jgi:hypothetical protein